MQSVSHVRLRTTGDSILAYNADPLVHAFDKHFSENNGETFFSVPGDDFKIGIDEDEYYLIKSKIEYASKTSRSINVLFGILGMLVLFWFSFVKGDPFTYIIPVWMAVFVLGIVSGSILIRSALGPLYRRHREEWARANDLPPPSALHGPLDIIKAEAGRIIVAVLLWSYVGIREILDLLN